MTLSKLAVRQPARVAQLSLGQSTRRLTLVVRPVGKPLAPVRHMTVVQWLKGEPLLEQVRFLV